MHYYILSAFIWTLSIATILSFRNDFCEPVPSQNIKPVDQDQLKKAAKFFCNNFVPDYIDKSLKGLPVKKTVRADTSSKGGNEYKSRDPAANVFQFEVSLVDECIRDKDMETIGSLNPKQPQPEKLAGCEGMMPYTWDYCMLCILHWNVDVNAKHIQGNQNQTYPGNSNNQGRGGRTINACLQYGVKTVW